MAYFLFKIWPEQLLFAERKDIKLQNARIPLTFIPIDSQNYHLVSELRGEAFVAQFAYQLSQGDFGYFAYHGDEPVAYGWVKHAGSDDYFFNIAPGAEYLCRFFTRETARGQGVYPAVISALVEHEADCGCFYIDIERGNTASQHGLEKVGFRFVKEYRFLRGFKHTFNKKWIRCTSKDGNKIQIKKNRRDI